MIQYCIEMTKAKMFCIYNFAENLHVVVEKIDFIFLKPLNIALPEANF